MRPFITAGAVLALAGSAYGFIVHSITIQAGESISPSSGSFMNSYSGFYLGAGKGMVSGEGSFWNDSRAYIETTTWLALDRAGGADGFSGSASYGKGGIVFDVPEFNASHGLETYAGTPGVDVGLLDDGSAILGGSAGYSWSAPASDEFMAPSSVSTVNGVEDDSIFIANLALTDPNAWLTGADLLVDITLGGTRTVAAFPLDGWYSDCGALLYAERDRLFSGQLELFIGGIPAPGGALPIVSLAAAAWTRRRRGA
jgi:hypothetical protein